VLHDDGIDLYYEISDDNDEHLIPTGLEAEFPGRLTMSELATAVLDMFDTAGTGQAAP